MTFTVPRPGGCREDERCRGGAGAEWGGKACAEGNNRAPLRSHVHACKMMSHTAGALCRSPANRHVENPSHAR